MKTIEERFNFVKVIGQGGMSTVFLAEDKKLQKNWAVKKVRRYPRNKEEVFYLSALEKEVMILKNLDSPFFPRIVDVLEDEKNYYFLMDYIEGEDLLSEIKKNRFFPMKDVIDISIMLSEALHELHSLHEPVIYCDLKPSNIIRKKNGKIVLIDFGAALLKNHVEKESVRIGTEGYAPKELFDKNDDIDERTDIYSFGKTMEVLLSHCLFKDLRKLNRYKKILSKCTKEEKKDRYDSILEVHHDLLLLTKEKTSEMKRKVRRGLLLLLLFLVLFSSVLFSVKENKKRTMYSMYLTENTEESLLQAIELRPKYIDKKDEKDAYHELIRHFRIYGATDEELRNLGNLLLKNCLSDSKKVPKDPKLFHEVGKLYLVQNDLSLKERVTSALPFFMQSEKKTFQEEKLNHALTMICLFMTEDSRTSEHTKEQFEEIFMLLEETNRFLSENEGNEKYYNQAVFSFFSLLFIHDEALLIKEKGVQKSVVFELFASLLTSLQETDSSLDEVKRMKVKMNENKEAFLKDLHAVFQ